MTDGFKFQASCPECAGVLRVQATGTPSTSLTQSIVACTECSREFVLRVKIEPTNIMESHCRPSTAHPVVATLLAHSGRARSGGRP